MSNSAATSAIRTFVLLALVLSPRLSTAQTGIQPGDALVGSVLFDGAPKAGVPVELHRITEAEAGTIAASVTDAGGSFRFELRPDTTAQFNVFMVTADNLGVRYFGTAIHDNAPVPTDYSVTVYDTVSVLPQPIRVSKRDVAIAALGDGAWEVNEAIWVNNPNPLARVAPMGQPSWQLALPEGVTDFEVADEGDIRPHEVALMENRVMVLTPMTPGERLLYMRYRLPPRPTNASITIGEATDTFNLYVRQPSHLSEVIGLQTLSRVDADGEEFLKYSRTALAPPATIELVWSGAWSAPVDPVTAAIVITTVLLAIGAAIAYRNRSLPPAV